MLYIDVTGIQWTVQAVSVRPYFVPFLQYTPDALWDNANLVFIVCY